MGNFNVRDRIGKYFVIISASFCFLLLVQQAHAEKSWWEKGVDVFNSVSSGTGSAQSVTLGEITQAFKEALNIGSKEVVKQLGQTDGFNGDAAIHIPLPDELSKVKSVLSGIGFSGVVDDLELKLNRAAEAATPKAKALFVQAITEMTFDDVQTIYKGPDDAATQYFQEKMTPSLREEMRPIVQQSIAQVGAIQTYDQVMGKYQSLPFVPDVKADLTDHVLAKALDGIFYYIAKEEAAIRQDPAKQTTDLLKRVFGQK